MKKPNMKENSKAEKHLKEIKKAFWDLEVYAVVRNGKKLRDDKDNLVLKCKTEFMADRLVKLFEAIDKSDLED